MRHPPIDPDLFVAHRRRLAALLPPGSVAIVHAADILPTTGDGTLPLHPAGDLFWLTGIEQEETVLVLAPDAGEPRHRELLFVRQPSSQTATWEGEKLTQEAARTLSGVAAVHWTTDLPAMLHGLLCACSVVYLNANEHERASTEVDTRDLRLARRLLERYPLHRHERLAPLLRRLRAVKDPAEVALIRSAIDITARGLETLATTLEPGVMEYELEAELARAFIRERARFGYEPIVASGANACVLHYRDNDRECRAGDLVLVDVGASYANYNADLTRTYPVSGRFTPRQRAVYEAVLRVLQKSVARAVPGTPLRAWKRAAQRDMAAELVALGLVSAADAERDSDTEPACRKYFMHGLGHSLGLGVHDLAPIDGPLEPGWVVTVEPGIYIPDEGFGVRLENDILITESEPVDLSSHVPITPDEIERLMLARPAGRGRIPGDPL